MNIAEWGDALFKELVAGGLPDRLLYLYVDRSVLGRTSGLSEEAAVEDFCAAYRADMGTEPFRRQWQSMIAWRRANWDGPCPFLPALAMTVLAVTEDPLGASHGIYRRLNSLLGLSTEAQQPPKYQDHVPAMWEAWNEWLAGRGACYGRPSARTHPHWTYQGWARSQGLIRYRDRLQIEDFVAGIRLPASQDLNVVGSLAPSLTDQFRSWLGYRGKDGERFLGLIDDEAAREIVSDVLVDEAARWARLGSRNRLPSDGLLHALYFYDAWEAELQAVLPVSDRLREQAVTVRDEHVLVSDFDTHLTLPLPGPATRVLDRGAAWDLRPGLRARISPSPVVVLADDPLLGGLAQVRGRVVAATYTLLCRDDLLGDVRQVLAGQGPLTAEPAGPEMPGWSWVRGVQPTFDSEMLRALGIGSLAMHGVISSMAVSGGLRVAGSVYLTGGEPDLTAQDFTKVTLDGHPLTGHELATVGDTAVLADLILDPGSHVLADADGTTIAFETVTHVREIALGSTHLQNPLESLLPGPGVANISEAAEYSEVGRALPSVRTSGALTVTGGPSGTSLHPGRLTMLRSRVLPGRHALVLREDGGVVEVFPTSESWLSEIGLDPTTVDVLRAVRTMTPRPAFFLELAPRLQTCTAVEIPEGTELLPGKVEQHPADQFLAAVISGTWVTSGAVASRDRRQTVLGRAMLRGTQSRPPTETAGRHTKSISPTKPGHAGALPVRSDVTSAAPTGNPYDDVLTWLSERESASASIPDFAQTWAWACRRHGFTDRADRYSLALARLGDLGFVETDWSRRRIHVAAPAAVELVAANGLLLLTGARPVRLLERLEDDEDHDPDVARAAQLWMVHRRTQTDPAGEPAAPTIVYLEVDTSQVEHVTAGLRALGIHISAEPSHALLSGLPGHYRLSRVGLGLAVSPGRDIQRLRSEISGGAYWSETSGDRGRGLYRYRLARGDQYAWRASPDAPLLSVTRAAGLWLDDAQHPQGEGHRRRLVYMPGTRTLMVTKNLTLPWAIRRALTLRTGLVPTLSEAQGHHMPQAGTHLVFRNIDASTADAVGRVLGREPGS